MNNQTPSIVNKLRKKMIACESGDSFVNVSFDLEILNPNDSSTILAAEKDIEEIIARYAEKIAYEVKNKLKLKGRLDASDNANIRLL